MFITLNLLSVYVISFIVVSSIKSSTLKWVVSILFSMFLVLEISSLFIGGSLIDYKFYVHLNLRDMLALKSLFSLQIVFSLVALVIFCMSIYWIGTKVSKLNLYLKKYYRYGIVAMSIFVLSLNKGIIYNVISIVRIVNSTDVGFEKALSNLNMDSYTPSDKVKAEKGKNVIIISLESYERGYLSDAMAHLTPNIRSLKKKWNYYDMKQTSGSGWTSASLYTYLTGFPAFFQGNGNLVFQKSYSSKITSISHVFKKAGYQMTYLVGNAEFAGTKDLLKVFQITNIIDYRKLKEKYETNKSWGIHDKDLFEEAKLEINAKKQSDKPFALFISTISTHNPNGVYDSRMEGLVKSQKSDIEFMAASIDYLIGDFINFLEKKDMLSNTVIYIFPDHLKMGDGSMFSNTGNRGLYLLTNASAEDISIDDTKNIYQVDLPKIILKGAQIKNNTVFLTDFIIDDTDEYIKNNMALIAALNNSGLERENIWKDKIFISKDDSSKVIVEFDKNIIVVDSLDIKPQKIVLSFSDEMRMIKLEKIDRARPFIESKNITLSFYIQNGELFASLQQGTKRPVLKSNNQKITYSIDDVNTILKEIERKKQRLFYWENNEPMKVDSESGRKYLQYLKDVPYDITEGIIEVEYSTSGGARPFIIFYGQPYSPSTIVFHDELETSLRRTKIRLSFNKLIEKPALVFRNWSEQGKFFIHNYKIIGYGYDNGIRFTTKTKHRGVYASNKNRFIAHAGGSIEGKIYTNSLEALNSNYEKGFRLFELDIIQTSDEQYVATHDWAHWSKITGYKGKLPVSEKEFLKHKIYNKYTPLNMKLINNWFQKHSDAILVTDKVNEPKQFSQLFVDKTRLMMELFSLEAVKEGLTLGIKAAMPTEKVVTNLGKNKVSILKSMGVKEIVVSRRFIAPNINLMKELKNNDIKVYVFHVNFDNGKDENYVVNYEMDFIYGLYADNWDFK